MKQVVIVGGGETHDTHEEYLQFLREMKYELPSKRKKRGWKENLGRALGSRYQVINLKMPNPLNAKYEEWCIYFDKVIPHLTGDVILVGHSLGGLFLMKYLSGLWMTPGPVALSPLATMLVASPYDTWGDKGNGLADFKLKDTPCKQALGDIHWFHGPDDTIVTAHHSYMGQMCMGGELHLLPDRGHFIYDERFPELVKIIKAVK